MTELGCAGHRVARGTLVTGVLRCAGFTGRGTRRYAVVMLDLVVAALRSGDVDGALDNLVTWWRAAPAEALADALCDLGTRAGDDVTRAIAHVCEGSAAEALERVVALERAAPDPRIARAVVAWVSDPPYHATSSKPFWRAAFGLLANTPDAGAHAALAKVASKGPGKINGATMRAWLTKEAKSLATPPAAAMVTKRDVAVLAKAIAGVAAAVSTAAGSARAKPRKGNAAALASTEAELLRAIREAPEDDGARLVYADWLLERDDPRGELIQLQLARTTRTLSTEEQERELALIKQHAKAWIGEPSAAVAQLINSLGTGLSPKNVSSGVRFDRGFAASFPLIPPPWGQMSAGKLRKLCGHPAFATVADFTIGAHYARNFEIGTWPIVAFLADPSLRGLRRLALPTVLIPELARGPHASQITWLETTDYQNATAMTAAIDACTKLPALEVLAINAVDREESMASDPKVVATWQRRLGKRVEIRVGDGR